MEIQPNQRTTGLDPAMLSRPGLRRHEPTTDQVSFAGTTAVNRALEETPAKRTEVIERARKLVSDPAYPPRETIQKLSELLALRMDSTRE